MRRIFDRFSYTIFVLAFSFQTAFTAVPTALGHANQIIAGGMVYINATGITNVQARKDRFLGHVADQHLGLNPNSYATYNPVGSDNKELRSELILANAAPIGGIGVVARRQEVEEVALHMYLFEVINDHSRPTGVMLPTGLPENKTFKNHIHTIQTTTYTQQFLDSAAPQPIKTQRTQIVYSN
jgi:hypothetical protein